MAHSSQSISITDCLEGMSELDDNSIDCIVTSPPYNKKGLLGKVALGNQIWGKFNIDYNSYGDDMPEEDYQAWMVAFLNECYRVIKPDAYLPTDFLQHSYANLYQLIIWDRRNSPNIRNDVLVPCTEHIYWLCKDKPKTFRNALDSSYIGEVWVNPPERQKKHPAPFPEQLVRNCILLTTEENDTILDPFMGSGTTALVSQSLNRRWLGFEIDEKYAKIAEDRLNSSILSFT